MSDYNPHQHLHNNLVLLHEFKPGGADFIKCVKENMFSKPNRTGFDQVLFYLCKTYDPVRYMPKVPWPILDRSQERTFRQNTVAFIKDVIKEKPEARIPPFSPSFLSTPGGERLTKFMAKFSLLVLKTVLERDNDVVLIDYPTVGLDLLQTLSESNLHKLAGDLDDLCQLIIDSSIYAQKLANDIQNQNSEIQSLQCELAELLQHSEHCPLTDDEKKVLVHGSPEESDSVLKKWLGVVNTRADGAKILVESLKTQSTAIRDCYHSVKTLVHSKTMPVVLDGTLYPSELKDSDGKLDLALVFSEGAKAANMLLNSISMYGGFQSCESQLPVLENIREQLQEIEASLLETKAGFIDLMSSSLENRSSVMEQYDQPETPLKGGLQLGYEVLQDVQTSTPPLVFEVNQEALLKSRISAESPPIDTIAMRPNLRGRFQQDTGSVSTPKSLITGHSSKSILGKNSLIPSVPTKNLKSLSAGLESPSYPSVMQTPANFCPKQFVTSTACKVAVSPDKVRSSKCQSGYRKGTQTQDLFKKKLDGIEEVSKYAISSPLATIDAVPQEGNGGMTATVKKESPKSPENILKPGSKCDEAEMDILLKNQGDSTTMFGHVSKTNGYSSLPDSKPKSKQEQVTTLSDIKQHSHTSPVGIKKPTSASKGLLKPSSLVAGYGSVHKIASPQSACTSGQSPQEKQIFTPCRNKAPPSVVVDRCLDDMFDSPQSTNGMFSPSSAENSFFAMDMPEDTVFSAVKVSEFDLDFEDEISPSGRVSLCPSDIQEPKLSQASVDPKLPEKAADRRQSIQALIHRYRDLKASSKPYVAVEVSPPTSPEPQLLSEEMNHIDINFDLNLE